MPKTLLKIKKGEAKDRRMGIGSIITISISKTKKIIAILKNCKENGVRAIVLGSNPHSKGEVFSLSIHLFLEKKRKALITNKLRSKKKIKNLITLFY